MAVTCFRIFNTNYADQDILASFTESSEQTSFPADNVLNQQRRSKVWRSNGYWVIDSTNRNIVFRETTGVDLTAILNTGTYTSTTSFMTELKRALDAAGSSTYTVTQDNLKFKFVSNGVGGGGIFEMYLTGTTVSGLIGMTSNKTGSLTHTMDVISVTQEEWLEFDLGISTNPKAFIMVDQRNEPFKVLGTVKLQGNLTGNFSSPTVDLTLTNDDEVFSYITDTGIHTTGLRYWRVKFEKTDMPTGYFQVGAIFLGDFLSPARGRAQFPLRQSYIDRSTTSFSEGGQSFTDIRQKTQSFSVEMRALQKEDVEEFDVFFNEFGIGKPFFVSMDTGEVWSTNKNRRIILCKFDSVPNYQLISPDNFSITFTLREEL